MNKHLNDLMEGLTAKVFRTFNASNTLQEQLDELTDPKSSVTEKVAMIICNYSLLVLISIVFRFWHTTGLIVL